MAPLGQQLIAMKLGELSQKKPFERLDLNECSFRFAWRYPEIDIRDIIIEEQGKFRIDPHDLGRFGQREIEILSPFFDAHLAIHHAGAGPGP